MTDANSARSSSVGSISSNSKNTLSSAYEERSYTKVKLECDTNVFEETNSGSSSIDNGYHSNDSSNGNVCLPRSGKNANEKTKDFSGYNSSSGFANSSDNDTLGKDAPLVSRKCSSEGSLLNCGDRNQLNINHPSTQNKAERKEHYPHCFNRNCKNGDLGCSCIPNVPLKEEKRGKFISLFVDECRDIIFPTFFCRFLKACE